MLDKNKIAQALIEQIKSKAAAENDYFRGAIDGIELLMNELDKMPSGANEEEKDDGREQDS